MESYHYQQLPLQPSSWPQTNYISVDNSSSTLTTAHQNPKEKRNGKRGPGIKLSTDPQSVAARQRRHRISDRFRILKSLVPGGSKMDTVSMLEEAISYVKFLKAQIWLHQAAIMGPPAPPEGPTTLTSLPSNYYYNNHSGGSNSIDVVDDTTQATSFDDYSNLVLPFDHHQPLPPPPLTPFPYNSFQQGEEIMLPNVSFSYYN